MSVEVNGTIYEGAGPTKKKAKLLAAEKALSSFVQFPNASEAAQVGILAHLLRGTRPRHLI